MDSLPDSFNPNKRLKEEFVSNLSGSSMMEIAALTTIIPILLLLRHKVGFHRVVGFGRVDVYLGDFVDVVTAFQYCSKKVWFLFYFEGGSLFYKAKYFVLQSCYVIAADDHHMPLYLDC
ncbi:uncharacterized protein LOC126609310 [Malus sylvestris]|uniref:uncharacterized protein LOC126609310 n=1 Tax=Malus sylvestris TaxID=3752 RepID=UPI0021AC673A|nr:uncharacterized protein LOC126609310 [Malus sylvestris]